MKRFYHPLNLYDLERLAEERLATDYWHVVAGGVGDEITVRRNREALDAIAIRPRLLTDVTTRDLSTTVLGHRISFPVMVPPAGAQVWAHPDGDVATARACCAHGTVMSLRAGAGKTVAEVRRATTGPLWYGVKHYPDEVTEYLIGRAMEAGVQAICITIAGPGMGATRQPDVRGFSPSHDAPMQSYVGKWADLADRPDLAEMMEDLDGVSYPSAGRQAAGVAEGAHRAAADRQGSNDRGGRAARRRPRRRCRGRLQPRRAHLRRHAGVDRGAARDRRRGW